MIIKWNKYIPTRGAQIHCPTTTTSLYYVQRQNNNGGWRETGAQTRRHGGVLRGRRVGIYDFWERNGGSVSDRIITRFIRPGPTGRIPSVPPHQKRVVSFRTVILCQLCQVYYTPHFVLIYIVCVLFYILLYINDPPIYNVIICMWLLISTSLYIAYWDWSSNIHCSMYIICSYTL